MIWAVALNVGRKGQSPHSATLAKEMHATAECAALFRPTTSAATRPPARNYAGSACSTISWTRVTPLYSLASRRKATRARSPTDAVWPNQIAS